MIRPAVHGTQVRSATDAPSLTATVAADNAGILAPAQDLNVSVTVANTTQQAFPSGSASLWLAPKPLASRAALTTWLASTDEPATKTTLGTATLPPLEPGTSTVVRVAVPAAAVPFAANPSQAVYGIGAQVASGSETAGARGTVVWNPGVSGKRSAVSAVMPIVSPASSSGLMTAAELTTYTAPNGVLTRDLDGLVGHSTVALGIDPRILASIRALGNAAPPTALDWLTRLAGLPNDTFSLAFGDADVTGQLQSGLPAPLAPTSFDYALDPKNFTPAPTPIGVPSPAKTAPAGTATPSPAPTAGGGPVLPTLDALTAWDYSLTGIAWPGDETMRSADVAPLAAAGLKTTIVTGDNTNAASLTETPDATLPVQGNTVLVADQGISDAVRRAAGAPSDAAWNAAMSKANAQLELVSKESGEPKRLLVALDRSWPSSGTQLDRTLSSLFAGPWTTPATLGPLHSAPSTSGLSLKDAGESPARIDTIKALVQDEHALDDFSSVLDVPLNFTGRVRAELLTLLAVSWQNPRSDWSAAVTTARTATVRTLHAIKILPTENVNLVSAQGSIPFTVSNGLPGDPATVVLTAAPSNSRLEIDQNATKRIPADSRATMLVPVKAKLGNGQVVLSLRLYSPTGVPIGDPTAVTVEVHADWEGIGAIIFGALVVLLFGFGIVRNILRRRGQPKSQAQAPTPEDARG